MLIAKGNTVEIYERGDNLIGRILYEQRVVETE